MSEEKKPSVQDRTKNAGENPEWQHLANTVRVGFETLATSERTYRVSLQQDVRATADEALWRLIKSRTRLVGFDTYGRFIDTVFRGDRDGVFDDRRPVGERIANARGTLQHYGVFGTDAYQLLKSATELFLMMQCGRLDEVARLTFAPTESERSAAQDAQDAFAELKRDEYLAELGKEFTLPYFALIAGRLKGVPVKDLVPRLHDGGGSTTRDEDPTYGILRSRVAGPCFIELIWSYWQEQGMLVQTANALSIRFQNLRRPELPNPLTNFALDPLRPLSNILWGYVQDEQHRLSLVRRAYEYDSQYGLRLQGKAVPSLSPADSRYEFIPAFHDLLYRAWAFLKEDDVLTVRADAFPVLNALRGVHFILAEGAHNQFGDLPWQARGEMLMQQWLLSRPEVREFLRGRPSVPYPEPWMDVVDTMKEMQGWTDVSAIHFNDLATFGEQLLLSIRYGAWSTTTQNLTDHAANWARAWREAISQYMHAYRLATGVDLTVGAVGTMPAHQRDGQPSILSRGAVAMRRADAAVRAPRPAPALGRPAAGPALPPGQPVPTAIPLPSRTPR